MMPFNPDCEGDSLDRHDPVSITLGEWYEMGFYKPYELDEAAIVPNDEWAWDFYTLDQYKRVCDKFLNHYYYREIGVFPPFRWRLVYRRAFDELMPKYKPLYERVEAGFNPLQESDEYTKSRDIFSDFPATMLTGNSDYASTGSDREQEIVREGNITEAFNRYVREFQDIDIILIEEVGKQLFSSLMTATAYLW